MTISSKKLLLILSVGFMGLQSDAMWLGKPLITTLAKRSAVVRMPAAVKTIMRTQLMPTKVAPSVQSSQSFAFKSKRLFNAPRAWTFKRLVGTGVAFGAIYAAASCQGGKTKAEQTLTQYHAPFEESRKKFYQDLESKPWGEVAKKYIKALQEEEQKLIDELCSIFKKFDAEEFKYCLNHSLPLSMEAPYRTAEFEDENEGAINFLKKRQKPLPQALVNQINSLLIQCCIDPQKIIILENNWNRRGGSEAGASQSSIQIAGKLVGAFDKERYPLHYTFNYDLDIPRGLFSHEIQHILHNDTFIFFCIENAPYMVGRKENGKTRFSYEFIDMKAHIAFQKKYRKFMEKRADLMGGLVSPECALGEAKLFNAISNYIVPRLAIWIDGILGGFHETCPDHPLPFERAAYMNQLHKEMLEAMKTKK